MMKVTADGEGKSAKNYSCKRLGFGVSLFLNSSWDEMKIFMSLKTQTAQSDTK
jgi:hypothetical protein